MFSAGSSVGGLRLGLIPVHIPLNQREAVVHLVHRQQGHLGENAENRTRQPRAVADDKVFVFHPNLQITIDEPVGFKVVVVFSEGIYELFSHLGP